MKLTWKKAPISNRIVAKSNKHEHRSYWIQEVGWSHLEIFDESENGPMVTRPIPFLTIEDAQEYAENQE